MTCMDYHSRDEAFLLSPLVDISNNDNNKTSVPHTRVVVVSQSVCLSVCLSVDVRSQIDTRSLQNEESIDELEV